MVEFSGINLREVASKVVPGGLLVAGTWYLHRAFLMKRFPSVAGDVASLGQESLAVEVRLLLCLVAAAVAGIVIGHISDIAIALFVDDQSDRTPLVRASMVVADPQRSPQA